MSAAEVHETFDCFGSVCGAHVIGAGPTGSAREAAELVRHRLLGWHEGFSRFLPDSELSRLNRDPRAAVPVSAMLSRLARTVRGAGRLTGGLVDGTLLDEIEHAGYAGDPQRPLPLRRALELAPPRRPAAPGQSPGWRQIETESSPGAVLRPPGVKLDSGGLAKGMFADVLAQMLAGHSSFAIDCAGDLAIGGADGLAREVNVESPFDARTLHTFQLRSGAVATSGIGRRSWLDDEGRPAHHLLDPSTGRPAFTGIVQATALAPSALTAEIYAKAAILSGPRHAERWLPAGGVIVFDDGSHRVIEPPQPIALDELTRYASSAAQR